MARSESYVRVICEAESYPPANSADNYQIEHPSFMYLSLMVLPGKNGVMHEIVAANKQVDTGLYQCTVTLTLSEYGNRTIQSEKQQESLIVYGELNTFCVIIMMKDAWIIQLAVWL